jgi:hypothetical protein
MKTILKQQELNHLALNQLRLAKQELEEEFRFYIEHGHRWPDNRRTFEIEGDRGLAGLMAGSSIVWELDKIQAMIASIESRQAENKVEQESVGFKPSPDFRSIVINNQRFTLSAGGAKVVEILFEWYKKGMPEISRESLLEELGKFEKYPNRIRDLFRNDKAAYKTLIDYPRKGFVRLNIP